MKALAQAAYILVHAHTVGRVRSAYAVATFPLVTDRYADPKFWAACGRLAWRGLVSLRPDALKTLVTTRRQVERLAELDAVEMLRRRPQA